jgi:anti-sigma B factor antagonist
VITGTRPGGGTVLYDEAIYFWVVRRYPPIVGKGRVVPNIAVFKAFRTAVGRQYLDGQAVRIVVQATGDVDVATSAILAAAISRAMERAMAAGDRPDLVIDLSRVRFIDASGINVLVGAAHQASACGVGLVLRSPSRAVRRMLGVLHLDAVLAVE